MKVKRKRSNRSVRVRWNFPDMKINICFEFSLKVSHFSALNSLEKSFHLFTSSEGRLARGEVGRGA